MIGRPRKFDETVVLDAVMHRFWNQGYEATSVRDLGEEMGVAGASLHNAFGDKRALYRRAVEHYVRANVHEPIRRIEATLPPLAALYQFFADLIDHVTRDPLHRGCLLVNAAAKCAPYDADLTPAVAEDLSRIEGFLRRCVTAGQADGTISAHQSADGLARMLLSVHLGICVLARVKSERNELESAAATALASLAVQPLPS